MSLRAWVYVSCVLLSGGLVIGVTFTREPQVELPWLLFSVLGVCATIAQLWKAEAPVANLAFFATPVFFFAGVMLLPPQLFVVLVVIPHVAEWVQKRIASQQAAHLGKWYIQPFNIAMHIIAGSAGHTIYTLLKHIPPPHDVLFTPFVALLSAAVYLIVNQTILGLVLFLARGLSWRESGALSLETLFPEYIMLCLGMVIAVVWSVNPGWIVPALAPLVLMYRALMVPQLQQEAQTDGKTGLYNARHFQRRFTEELERAQRFNRPLAMIMADLDLLRDINNTYGHLAGDMVLEGIGKIIRQTVRDYDIAGRFGGEEFAIVLPETSEDEAKAIAECIRRTVESTQITTPNNPTPIRATISLGVACFPDHATTQIELVHEADVAVYQAKFYGRNQVVCASNMPHSTKLKTSPPDEQKSSTYSAAFRSKTARNLEITTEPHATTKTHQKNDQPATLNASPPGQHALPSGTAVKTTTTSRRRANETRLSASSQTTLWCFVGGVIIVGTVLAALGIGMHPEFDLVALGVLVVLALTAELRQLSVYDDNSVSASMALTIAAALISGMVGLIVISAAIAIADQIQQRRSYREFYKVLFNWATHIIAGIPPVLIVHPHVVSLDIFNLLLLAVLTALASLLYYGIETVLISIAISLAQRTQFLQTWRNQFQWLAAHYLVLGMMGLCLFLAYQALQVLGIIVFALPVLMLRYSQQQYILRTQESMRELKRMNRELALANHEIVAANQAIQHMNDELFLTLGTILDARDPYVSGHAAQVATYAAAIAVELGLPPERVEVIRQAGFLHDLGKIAISEQILYKPSKLTEAEYEIMKTHATVGAAMLETSTGLRHLAPFIRAHHERWDGQGYPHGLRGEEIPLEARILNVCDSVEAMAADRPYHNGMPLPAILDEVRRCAGTQFDPVVAEIFIRVAKREGERFVINSAREVLRRQLNAAVSAPHSKELAEVYRPKSKLKPAT